jgi:hypothetical protein
MHKILPMRLRLLPPSTEGFRRISIVLAIVTFLGLMGWRNRDDSMERERHANIYIENYLEEEQRCWREEPAAQAQACVDRANEVEQRGLHLLYDHPLKEKLESWAIYSIAALFCAYLAALCARTLGWIALGFNRPTQS